MAKRLFLFGIGGTGARVVKSLTFMLASGCKLPGGVKTLVPILIDPDTANGDLNRTKDILRLYQSIRANVDKPDDFFGQEIKTINELTQDNTDVNTEFFQFELKGAHDNKFKEYIGYNSLDDKDKHFLSLLYSSKNLDSDLDVGFKGNPHMGSIVLNQFTESDDFKKFAQSFTSGDAIFIVNSIFGGTGAAGFPLLLNTLRHENAQIQNSIQYRNAPVGGITYLPYFKVENDEESEINSDAFEEKAKMALNYYNRTIIKEEKLNSLYFLGHGEAPSVYENHEGKNEQKNKAHFLEVAGALAVFDFCKELNQHLVENGKAVNGTTIKEFGIERDQDVITFNDLNSSHEKLLKKNLTRYRFFSLYLSKGLSRALGVAGWTKNGKLILKDDRSLLDKEFFDGAEYRNYIKAFCDHFDKWIDELNRNKPSFSPFKKYVSPGNSLDLLSTKERLSKDGFKELDKHNAFAMDKINSAGAVTQLIKMFQFTTKEVLEKNKLI